MKTWLAVLALVLLAVLVSPGAHAQGTVETTEKGLGIIFSVGSDKENWDATLVMDHVAPGDGVHGWRFGGDLAVGRCKRFASVPLELQVAVTGMPKDKFPKKALKFEFVAYVQGVAIPLAYDANRDLWVGMAEPSRFSGATMTDQLEIGWRDKNGSKPFVRALFKLTLPFRRSVTEYQSIMVDTMADPCESTKMTGAYMAQTYRYYQKNVDPTLGGGVTDSSLLVAKATESTEGNKASSDSTTKAINSNDKLQDERMDEIDRRLNQINADSIARDKTLAGEIVNGDAAVSSKIPIPVTESQPAQVIVGGNVPSGNASVSRVCYTVVYVRSRTTTVRIVQSMTQVTEPVITGCDIFVAYQDDTSMQWMWNRHLPARMGGTNQWTSEPLIQRHLKVSLRDPGNCPEKFGGWQDRYFSVAEAANKIVVIPVCE